MMGLAPGQQPRTAREHTTTVTHSQGGPLGDLDDPAGPADLQRLGRRTPKDRGNSATAAHSRTPNPSTPPGSRATGPSTPLGSRPTGRPSRPGSRTIGRSCLLGSGATGPWSVLGAWPPGPWSVLWPGSEWRWLLGWRVTSTRVTAPSQASRRHASGSSGPTPPTSPPTAWCRPRRLSRSTVTVSCGRTPPLWGSRPPSNARRANSVRASALRWLPLRLSLASAGRASGSRAASRVWPASGSNNPSTATIPSKVGASQSPRRA